MMTTHHLEYHYLIKYFSSLLHTLKISIFSTGIGHSGPDTKVNTTRKAIDYGRKI